MFSQFFIINPRGDSIIFRDYRGDCPKNTPEVFFRHIATLKDNAMPIFQVGGENNTQGNDGLNFVSIKQKGLYFVVTTKANISPSFAVEFLSRCSKVIKDYVGLLNEESIRNNFVLIYELLDEILDFGYPQGTSTEDLKSFVFNDPILGSDQTQNSSSFFQSMTGGVVGGVVGNVVTNVVNTVSKKSIIAPSSSATRPVIGGSNPLKDRESANEVFIDLIELLTVVFSKDGSILRYDIDGSIVVKSFLKGSPEICLSLNEDMVISSQDTTQAGYGVIVLDDCNFHECVAAKLQDFSIDHTLIFSPPQGEFTLMNYRLSPSIDTTGPTTNKHSPLPFHLVPFIDVVAPNRIEAIVKIRGDIPKPGVQATNVIVKIPVPKNTTSCGCDMDFGIQGQSYEYKPQENMVYWNIKRFNGISEQILRVKMLLDAPNADVVKKEIGPLSMEFDIPMYTCSGIKIRYLKVSERNKSYQPHRWIRYISQSRSYVFRI